MDKDGFYTIKPFLTKIDVLDVIGKHVGHKEHNTVGLWDKQDTMNQYFIFKASSVGDDVYTVTPACCEKASRQLAISPELKAASAVRATKGVTVATNEQPPMWHLKKAIAQGATDAFYMMPIPEDLYKTGTKIHHESMPVRLQFMPGLVHGTIALAPSIDDKAQVFHISFVERPTPV